MRCEIITFFTGLILKGAFNARFKSLLLIYILCISVTSYNDRVFLSGAKKRHSFIVDNESLVRDGKPMKTDGIKIYTFKNFVFLITKKTYYRIPNEEFVGISREEFLSFMKVKN